MRKIISLFQRNYDGDRLVRNEVVPGAEWVLSGEGVATRKWDGTCCLVKKEFGDFGLSDDSLWKRYEVKRGGKPPALFEPANDIDENTGKQQGWIPVSLGAEDQWHREAWQKYLRAEYAGGGEHNVYTRLEPGTYELVGPKIQGNPERLSEHLLYKHGTDLLHDIPRDFDGIKSYLESHDIEGIVWHHTDGRMVKIKGKDFGIKRGSGNLLACPP